MHTVPDCEVLVTLGVDTHGDVHVAVALDQLGGLLGSIQLPATRPGFRQLLESASSFRVIDRIGIEGNGLVRGRAVPLAAQPGAGRGRGGPLRSCRPPQARQG
jgi:hypothetical protein